MSWKRWLAVSMIGGTIGAVPGWMPTAHAKDFTIKLPKHSPMTPVQKLNHEGVEAIKKHRYEKAEAFFYKAYLLDPDDPFTLNNLGYISELQGQVDRALKFYEMAGEGASDAVISRSSARRLEGHPMKEALAMTDQPLQINHENVEAVRLLSQGRAPEADVMLQQVLKTDPNNVFTLNNMGVAKEMEGETQAALRYYDTAASERSDAAASVTLSRTWRGKPVSQLAAQNAKLLRDRIAHQTPETAVAQLNVRGVSALNRNDFSSADEDFRKAYQLDPNNAFATNNIGYLSEVEGDQETAQFFYEKAQSLGGANQTVGLATRRSAEGARLSQVASDNDGKVESKVSQEREQRRNQREPVLLMRRDNTPVQEPAQPPANNNQPQ